MGDRRTDPTFAMCRALVDGEDPASFAGSPFDIRTVVAAIRSVTLDEAVLDDLPWGNFPHGENTREAVRLLLTGDGSARNSMGALIGMCASRKRRCQRTDRSVFGTRNHCDLISDGVRLRPVRRTKSRHQAGGRWQVRFGHWYRIKDRGPSESR